MQANVKLQVNVKMRSIALVKKYGIFIVLIAISGLFAILSPVFLTESNLFNIMRQVSMIGIAAVGGMFVMLLGGIDLSQGALVSFINIVLAYMMAKMQMNYLLAIALSIAIGTVVGMVNGVLITKANIPPLIATLATQNILYGFAYIICEGQLIHGFPKEFKVFGQGYIGPIPVPVLLMVIFFVIGGFILTKTYFGRYIYAIGGNAEAAKLSGIKVNRIKQTVYMLSGLFTSVAAVITLSRINSGQANTGQGFEFDVITAIVLGGISVSGGSGKLYHTIAGVMIMGVLNNGLVLIGMSTYTQMVVKGVILAIAVGYDCIQKKAKA